MKRSPDFERRAILFVTLSALMVTGFQQSRTSQMFVDGICDYQMAPPAFAREEATKVLTRAIFPAAVADGFTANLNVQIQNVDMTLGEFRELSVKQFEENKFTVVSERELTVSGAPALEWVYTGAPAGRDMRFLALVIERDKQIYLLTCTALESNFKEYEKTFRESVGSFRFQK